ncbi:hypothetical protein QQY66_34350 [Streptomyces sp. DG2A-72]|uniref:hypothetical protein n=1 Tax=Streptomyces sp. DG2A-72 TaxID=3051386 RepID=UPI00265BE4D0|nr:hypothetical protein [Streptomyces sp. DG2A-72]MDO0936543.1 hypothetical protein [Streptomyces sp. DG2A-72]
MTAQPPPFGDDLFAGCHWWATALTDWHRTARPEVWRRDQPAPNTEPTAQQYGAVTALIAVALYATAREGGLDSLDGEALAAVPLEPVYQRLDEGALDSVQRLVKDVGLPADHASTDALAALHTMLDTGTGAGMEGLLLRYWVIRLAYEVVLGNVSAGPTPRGVDAGELVTMLHNGRWTLRLGDRMPYLLTHRATNGES